MAKVERGFEELLQLFNRHKVRYCVIGAFAVAFYAIPRYTKDLDILVEPNEANGNKIMLALQEFGFDDPDITASDFTEPWRFVQLGYEPVRVDLTTSIAGATFAQVWKGKKAGSLGTEKLFYIGIKELV